MEWSRLSLREQIVARQLASGLPNAEIGRRLCIGGRIIETYVKSLHEKTATKDRASLVAWIASHDLGEPLSPPAALLITQPTPTYIRRAGDAPLRRYVAHASTSFPIMPPIRHLIDSTGSAAGRS